MSVKRPPAARPLPSWLVLLASLFIAFHLLALGVLVLSAPSGPWLTPFGPSQEPGPAFAGRIAAVTTEYYLRPLQMTHNYHFMGNRPEKPGIFLEARLRDAEGRLIDTVRLPGLRDNAWLRQRHEALAQALGNDDQVPAPQGEQIAAPGQKAPTMKVWEPTGPNQLVYRAVETAKLPRNGTIPRPNDWALVIAHATMRHLAREHGVASVELIRHSRQPIVPAFLFGDAPPPPGTFDTLVSTFEEYHREK